MQPERVRHTYDLTGTVQGVGFRPTVHRLASAAGLGGWIQNRSGAVRLELHGDAEQIHEFVRGLPTKLPSSAAVQSCRLISSEPLPAQDWTGAFEILESGDDQALRVSFPPDLAVCPACLAEIANPADRRCGYAFTTCTHCGPRYTVINGMPYDRERTTLAVFPLCPQCRREYLDPQGRRFHAESIACPDCGPRLEARDASGSLLPGEPRRVIRKALTEGKIAAVRGIGGYLLAADAANRPAIEVFRQRKNRPHKPFAVMARNLAVLRGICPVSKAAEELLASPEAPIVILDVPSGAPLPLDLLSPDTRTLGVMLPNSPLHWLLFNPLTGDPTPPFDFLIMTSGNRRSEPICLRNDEAFTRLAGIADVFLCHDREINLRADDSLCLLHGDAPQIWRRGRGHTPQRLPLKHPLSRCVLAMGAELKNALALGSGAEIIPSAHIGDLETPEAVAALKAAVDALPKFLYLTPEAVAVDLHPDMHATVIGREYAGLHNLAVCEVQHHFAHAAAGMAEHGLTECLALVFDGTGLGTDGAIWGAELLHCADDNFTRLATFAPVPLPGGDAAVRNPPRQLAARLLDAGVELTPALMERFAIDPEAAVLWQAQIQKKLNTPMTHAAGRLFDAFAAMLGIAPAHTTYDGQAAIRLEAAALHGVGPCPALPFCLHEQHGILLVDWRESFIQLSAGTGGESAPLWALAAHHAVSRAAAAMVEYGLARCRSRTVVLSGGVFMNRILSALVAEQLEGLGLQVLRHGRVPPNDGGIAVGQAFIAGRRSSICV